MFRRVDQDVYREAVYNYEQARKRLMALGKTCTTLEFETAMQRVRAAEADLRKALSED
jgi:hypothetical protein